MIETNYSYEFSKHNFLLIDYKISCYCTNRRNKISNECYL